MFRNIDIENSSLAKQESMYHRRLLIIDGSSGQVRRSITAL